MNAVLPRRRSPAWNLANCLTYGRLVAVPVMVARRRLKRPPRRAAHLKAHRARVSLAQAAVDRVASKVDQDVAKMRSEIARDDERRSDGHADDVEDDVDTEVEGDAPMTSSPVEKVAGE